MEWVLRAIRLLCNWFLIVLIPFISMPMFLFFIFIEIKDVIESRLNKKNSSAWKQFISGEEFLWD